MMRAMAAPALALLLIHAASTLFMTGLIWFVQAVHYPLMACVGAGGFVAYEAEHRRRTTWVVAGPMLVEAATAALLLWFPPAGVPAAVWWAGAGLVGVAWLSTAFFQVPMHDRLSRGFDPRSHRLLTAGNWLRTLRLVRPRALLVLSCARAAPRRRPGLTPPS